MNARWDDLPMADFELPGVRLYRADCRDLLPTLPACSVDAVITDPVWPNAAPQLPGRDDPHGLLTVALEALPAQVRRLSIVVGCNTDVRFLSAVPATWPFFRVCWLRYARPHYRGRLLYTADVAYWFGSPPPFARGRQVIGGEMCRTSREERPAHPCPRSLEQTRWVVDKWSVCDEAVCDPFMGSGTTGVEAVRLGRRFIGIEIVPDWFDLARERIMRAYDEMAMFNGDSMDDQMTQLALSAG